MLKKNVILLGASFLLFTGCQAVDPNAQNIGMQGKGFTSVHQVDPNSGRGTQANRTEDGTFFGFANPPNAHIRMGEDKLFGFIEHTENDPEVVYSGYGAEYYLDRRIVADSISKIAVGLPDVHTASVLVTEDTCIIGYQARDNVQTDVQDQIIKTGMSVTPRWYKIYASADPQMIEQIRQIGQQHSDGNLDQRQLYDQVEQLAGRMSGLSRDQRRDMDKPNDKNR